MEATHAAMDASDDAREALEAASSPSEGERGGEGFGDDESSMRRVDVHGHGQETSWQHSSEFSSA